MDRPDFFTPSIRSRVIEFILKRKKLSTDVQDDFSFGIERALNEGIYTAAYPLHDVSATVWKFNNHSVIKTLREISFDNLTVSNKPFLSVVPFTV